MPDVLGILWLCLGTQAATGHQEKDTWQENGVPSSLLVSHVLAGFSLEVLLALWQLCSSILPKSSDVTGTSVVRGWDLGISRSCREVALAGAGTVPWAGLCPAVSGQLQDSLRVLGVVPSWQSPSEVGAGMECAFCPLASKEAWLKNFILRVALTIPVCRNPGFRFSRCQGRLQGAISVGGLSSWASL